MTEVIRKQKQGTRRSNLAPLHNQAKQPGRYLIACRMFDNELSVTFDHDGSKSPIVGTRLDPRARRSIPAHPGKPPRPAEENSKCPTTGD